MSDEADRTADPLDIEIAAFERIRATLQEYHSDKWAVVVGQKLWQLFPTFEAAAIAARKRFGDVTMVIDRVDAPQAEPLPSSLWMNTDDEPDNDSSIGSRTAESTLDTRKKRTGGGS